MAYYTLLHFCSSSRVTLLLCLSSKKNLCQQVIYLFICLVVFVTVLIALQEVGLILVMSSTCVIVYQVIKVNTQCVMMILLPFLGFFLL